MNNNERRQIEVLCETIVLILDTYYNNNGWLPNWLFKRWHPRARQVVQFKKAIRTLKYSIKLHSDYKILYDELIRLLDNQRYFLATHTVSKRLRLLVQDALIAALNFVPDDVSLYDKLIIREQNIPAYLEHFHRHKEIKIFREHFAKQHAFFGVPRELLSDKEITIYAKANMINGKLIEYFGIKAATERNIIRIKKELQVLASGRVEQGFLTMEKCQGLIARADRIIELCNHPTPEFDEATLIQYARYFLETIINTAGIKQLGTARYAEHAVLITACYWVDEVLKQAQVKEMIE